ncbi:hypothetical protein ACH5RR_023238 [Cinchona calisaya]|uniref:Uncharacterized protein n=1 Tax=Cinchona calisaya TaxID=153742 RepID=A0ABD2ZA32_9GENT
MIRRIKTLLQQAIDFGGKETNPSVSTSWCEDSRIRSEHSEELPASVLKRMYQIYRSYTRDGTKSMELHNFSGKLTETALSTRLATIQRQVEETSSASERKLKYLEAIQAKRISLEGRKAELIKELDQLGVETQRVDVEILKVNDEMSRDHGSSCN